MVGKYLMFIPVVALLLLFSNCANKKTDKAQSDTEKADTVVAVEPEKRRNLKRKLHYLRRKPTLFIA